MKRIKIIKNNPEDGQISIKHLVGQEFDATIMDNGQAEIEDDGKYIIIHEDEFEIVGV